MDIIYLTNVYKLSEAIPAIHASALKPWGQDLPWSWPHDGLQHDKGSGDNLADQYRREGLNMLPDRATFEDGSNGVEAGLMEILTRMENGTFKVFDSCALFFDEMLMYHRKDGKVVKEFDDVISACRYAIMMLRHSRPDSVKRPIGMKDGNNHQSKYEPLTTDAARGR